MKNCYYCCLFYALVVKYWQRYRMKTRLSPIVLITMPTAPCIFHPTPKDSGQMNYPTVPKTEI